MDQEDTPDKVECWLSCQNMEDCSWFSYNTEAGVCKLFPTCQEMVHNKNFITGERDCWYSKQYCKNCSLNIFNTNNIKPSAKLLVITMESEIVDLENADNVCENLPDAPYDVFLPTGGLVGDSPLICGGLGMGVVRYGCGGC